MAMSSAARWGAGAGALVLVAALGAGAVSWQADAFDAKFADLSQLISDRAQREGLTVVAEETGRDWRSRDLRVRLKAADLQLQWIGQARFGFGTSAKLMLDTSYGTAVELKELGIVGYRDSLVVEQGLFSQTLSWQWEAAPFELRADKATQAVIDGMSLEGTGDMTQARFRLKGIRAGSETEKLTVGELSAVFVADPEEMRNSSVTWTLNSIRYENGEATAQLGTSSLKLAATITDAAESLYRLDYRMDLGRLDEDGQRRWDSWKAEAHLNKVPEKLLLSAAFHEPDELFGVLAYAQYAFHRQGMTIEVPVNEWQLDESLARLTGRVADTNESLGQFEVSIDRAFAEKIPELKQEAEAWKAEGLLTEKDGRLQGNGVIDRQGNLFLNDHPL